jgi:AbrB family looped-hinge helix DNA binding protein
MDTQINEAGQIKIPVEIQKQLGLTPGSDVEIEIVDNVLLLRKKTLTSKGDKLIQCLRGKTSSSLTTDEVMRMTRDD